MCDTALYLLFLKRRVKERKIMANRMPQESRVHMTALNTGDRARLGSSTASCTRTHTHTRTQIITIMHA